MKQISLMFVERIEKSVGKTHFEILFTHYDNLWMTRLLLANYRHNITGYDAFYVIMLYICSNLTEHRNVSFLRYNFPIHLPKSS